jgi:hypothetical protein
MTFWADPWLSVLVTIGKATLREAGRYRAGIFFRGNYVPHYPG